MNNEADRAEADSNGLWRLLRRQLFGVGILGWLIVLLSTVGISSGVAYKLGAFASPPAGSPEPAVGLYWQSNTDPTAGGGVSAPLWQLLWRTDQPSVYYKSGTANTAWTKVGSGTSSGGSVTSITCGGDLSCTPANPITTAGTIDIAAIATSRLFGNVSGISAPPAAITGTQATTLLDVFTTTLKGVVPAPGSVTGKFLQDNGTWGTPAGTGVTGSGTAPDLTAWASSSSIGNYAGSSPSACAAGNALQRVTIDATGALTFSCVVFVNAGTSGVTVTGSTASLDSTFAPTFAGLTNTGPLTMSGILTVTDVGTLNNYSPAGLATTSVILFNGGSNVTLTGIAGGANGRRLVLCALSAGSIALTNEDAGSTSTNRFNFTAASTSSLTAGGTSKISCTEITYLGGSVNRWTQINFPASTAVVPSLVLSSSLTMNGGASLQGTLQMSGGVAHIRTSTASVPTLSSCGTGATVIGGDSMMTVTTGTGATGCSVTFAGSSWGSAHPACVVYPEGGAAFPAISYTGGTLGFALGAGTAASTSYDIHCLGTN